MGTGHHKYIHSQCFYKLIRFLSFPKWMKSANTQEAEHVQSNADGFMFAESGLRKLNQSDWVIGKLVENNLCSISSVYHSYKCDYCPWGMLEFELIYLVFVYRVSQKKCNIAISCLDLFQRSNLTFSHVFRNQNFELVPSGHITDNHSESKVP